MLHIELFGTFGVRRDGRAAPPRAPTARQQQILAFLILHAGDAVPRQRIAGSLWPDSLDRQALTNLRRELHNLREHGPDLDRLIDARTRTLAWRGDGQATVDVLMFREACDRGLRGDVDALDAAVRLYRGDLLSDCAEEWTDAPRAQLKDLAVSALTMLIERREQARAFDEAIVHAGHLLRVDPLREDAWRALMRCHAARGDRAGALSAYQQCATLLKHELGVQPSAETRIAYREVLDRDVPAAAASPPSATYPLVGRTAEWQSLLSAWRDVEHGPVRLVVIRGEAGIGKTRLAEELADWCRVKTVRVADARCYAGEGRLAYAPIAAWLKHPDLQPTLSASDALTLGDVARLHPAVASTRADVPRPEGPLESWQRVRFFDALAHVFRAAAPIVLIVDDVQWADADTLDWLHYFLRSLAGSPVLVVATLRAEEEADNAPLGRLLGHLAQNGLVASIALGPLDREATAQLADAVAEHPLDDETRARTFRDTEGHPLFIVERGRIASDGERPAANALSRVQSVVAARLALLSLDARTAAEAAAAIGRDFTRDLLAHAVDLDEAALAQALDELWRRQIVRIQPDGRWDFSHDRIREVAYSGIGPARAPLVHRHIARAMETLFADRLDDVSASIAMHLERGGQAAQAVPLLERAAAVAAGVGAAEEAIRCLDHALSLLAAQPAGGDRDAHELRLRASLSVVLNSARGYAAPEVERNVARVFLLTGGTDGRDVPVRWLWVAFTLRYMLGDLRPARDLAERALARSAGDPSCRCEAHHAMAGMLCTTGQLSSSREHFEAALAAYDERQPQQSALGSDLGVFAHGWYSHTLWLLGREGEAAAHADAAIALARRLDQPYSETIAFAYASLMHQIRGDVASMVACAETVVALCAKYGFGYYGDWAQVLIGWAQAHQDPPRGIEAIESALARLDAARAQARRPYYMSLLADAHRTAGHRARAAAIVDDAIAMAIARGDEWWLPALYFSKSALDPPAARGVALQRGVELARTQGSRALELRMLAAS